MLMLLTHTLTSALTCCVTSVYFVAVTAAATITAAAAAAEPVHKLNSTQLNVDCFYLTVHIMQKANDFIV